MLSVPFIICLIVIKDKPASPPNAFAEQIELNETITLKEYFVELL